MIPRSIRLDPEASDFDKAVVNSLNRELLKYAASKHMFCIYCNRILDWKTVVIFKATKGEKEGNVVMCNKCFNPEGVAKLEADGYETEVTTHKR